MRIEPGKFICKLLIDDGTEIENPTIPELDVEFKETQGRVIILNLMR